MPTAALLPFVAVLSLCTPLISQGQTLFVDAVNGIADGHGTTGQPVATLQRAVEIASGFTGERPITIKLLPGLYALSTKLTLRTAQESGAPADYTIEAAIMPDDPAWQPWKMPVIESLSPNNSTTQFTHSVGILVATNNVHFKGLKFVGNANPNAEYYYPITRENESLSGLEASQCYFIGEKNSAPVQSAIWAHGAGIRVDHCIFYGCKNALVLIKSIRDFSMTHSIVSGAYEAAVWYGPFLTSFVFQNNIITNCSYFWVRPENTQPTYVFSHSLFTKNEHIMGYFGHHDDLHPIANDHSTESDVRKVGKVILVEVKTEGLPHDYLNLSTDSDGKDLDAGIFKHARE